MGEFAGMRTDIVIIFLGLAAVFLVIFALRSTYWTLTEWWEDATEWANRRKLAAQLLREIENRPRERLVEIALAVALAPYNRRSGKTDDDEALVRARARYLAVFASLSDEDLKQWIDEKVQDTHSFLLKIALESLSSTANGRG